MGILAVVHVVVNNPIDYGPYIVAILVLVPGLILAVTNMLNQRTSQRHIQLNTGRIMRLEDRVNGGLEGHPAAVPVHPETLEAEGS